ncbi:hypothetical protein MNBD_GAMMA25-1994 [hydrothermal vent metagenome]|uniref:PEP-CTERM protein-sorting domain-containing protein n=1 Tax=hydrothermal vent metagenome TaxID=652676 RepID=A0A3B1AT98_9ZZZZ
MKIEIKKVLVVSAIFFASASSINAQIVEFSGDNSSGTGSVGASSFNWVADSGLINAFDNPVDFGWGRISDPSSSGFNLSITMDFDIPWTFNAINFEALNTETNDNVFNLQLFDSSLTAINTSDAVASTTSSFGSAPWGYNELNNSWQYSTLSGSINGHQAVITGEYSNVSRLVITVDDHLGLDYFNLDMSPTVVPVPAAVWLFGSGFLALVSFSRRKV